MQWTPGPGPPSGARGKFAAEIMPNRHRVESMHTSMEFSNKKLQKEKVRTKGMSETKTGGRHALTKQVDVILRV